MPYDVKKSAQCSSSKPWALLCFIAFVPTSVFFSNLCARFTAKTNGSVFSFFLYQIQTFNQMTFCALLKIVRNHVRTNPSFQIDPTCNRLKMVRVNASTISTQMIQMQTLWNRAVMQFIAIAMSCDKFFFTANTRITEVAIASTCFCTNPNPTQRQFIWFLHFVPKSFFNHFWRSCIKASQMVAQAR